MFKKIFKLAIVGVCLISASGCAALIGTALSAAAAYGIYQATKK